MKRILLFILGCTLAPGAFSQKLTVSGLTVDYRVNPVGTGQLQSGFSWKLRSTEKNVLQQAYEIRVSANRDDLLKGKNLFWNSGKVVSDQSIHVKPVLYLAPRQRYFWQVRSWDNQGNASAWSEVNYWETGLLNTSGWTAKWIEAAEVTNGAPGPAPRFFRAFNLPAAVENARLYVTAHGIYDATINGKKVTENVLTPGWTSYLKRLQYQVYDVTSLLKQGENATLVTIGDGWYRGFLKWQNSRNTYGKEAGLLYQLEVTLKNGQKVTVASDGTWKSSFDGPVKSSDIYNGEVFDSRLDGPVSPAAATNWNGVRVIESDFKNLVPDESGAVTRHERLKPLQFTRAADGSTIVDFGQNLVGWVQLNVKGTAGDVVKLNHAEVLNKDGSFYTDNLRAAKQENQFVLNGSAQVLEPHFTFQGFRYVRISGLKGAIDTGMLRAVVIHSAMTPNGTFTSSNALVNQLQHNIQWGQKGNFVDVPTDCPQRDERLGWTGDAQVFFNTAAFNMDVAPFFTKWLQDLKADQHASGNVPIIIPDVRETRTAGSAGWSDVATIIPWNFYVAYGDKELLARQYESMKAWVNFVKGISKDNLWNTGAHYGDWLFYTMADDRDGKAAITDKYFIAQVYWAASTQNLIHAAKVLGHTADAVTYTALLADIKQAFLNEYVTPSGRLVSSSQTAYVLALNFDMLPIALRQQAADRLAENIKSYGNHLTTGFLGTPYLCPVLSRFGHNDVAYNLLLQETYPSWLYPVKMGATTIWERWDGIKPDGSFQTPSMNSFNHYAYGAIGDWMYRTIAGITQGNGEAGYKNILIAPRPGGGLTHAAATLETLYGRVSSSWKTEGGKTTLDVEIPPNTTAVVVLPARPTEKAMAIGSGTYRFEF